MLGLFYVSSWLVVRLAFKLLDCEIDHGWINRVGDGCETCLVEFFALIVKEDVLAENYRLSGHSVCVGLAKVLRSSLLLTT